VDAQRRGDYARAGELQHSIIPGLQALADGVVDGGSDGDSGSGSDSDGAAKDSVKPMLEDAVTATQVLR